MADSLPVRKALVAGWFSYEPSDYTAGDLLAADVVCDWLREAGFDVEVARVPALGGGVDLESVNPADFSHAVFVCGPFMQNHWEAEFLQRFHGCALVGVNLTLPVPLSEWRPFDLLYERDSSEAANPDLAFAAPVACVPVVGVCRVDTYPPARVDLADAAIDRLLSSRKAALVSIDTRLDVNTTGLHTPAEVEALFARMDVLVTTRLHGLVLALKHGVPVVAIDAMPGGGKVLAQARTLGWPLAFDASAVDDAALARAFDACLTPPMRQLALECRDTAMTTIAALRKRFVADLCRARPVPAPPHRVSSPRKRLHVVHAIHDFLPRHAAGSEIYAFELCRALSQRHDVTVVCAEYAPGLPNGHLTWRMHEGVAVVEIANNWIGRSFSDTYRPALVGQRLGELLDALGPDVVHVHNLLNLSLDLPAMARARGIPTVATLHDYTWVCPSGGQRIHRAERHVCHEIEHARCARCFRDTAFYSQLAFGVAAPRPGLVQRAGQFMRRHLPRTATRMAGVVSQATGPAVSADDIRVRLDAAVDALRSVDLVVSPSPSLAYEYAQLGADRARLRVSDYGFAPLSPHQGEAGGDRLRIGFVGTIVWHKGVHVVVDALRQLPSARCELRIHGDLDIAPDYVADLRRRAAGLPVSFRGGFDRTGAAAVYAGLDVLVVPSIWLENSPLVIHEAFMAGVPVIASRIGGMVDLVRDGWNGWLVEPDSADALAARLRAIVDDRSSLRRAAARLPHVKSIEADAAAWECRYHEVIDARHAGDAS